MINWLLRQIVRVVGSVENVLLRLRYPGEKIDEVVVNGVEACSMNELTPMMKVLREKLNAVWPGTTVTHVVRPPNNDHPDPESIASIVIPVRLPGIGKRILPIEVSQAIMESGFDPASLCDRVVEMCQRTIDVETITGAIKLRQEG